MLHSLQGKKKSFDPPPTPPNVTFPLHYVCVCDCVLFCGLRLIGERRGSGGGGGRGGGGSFFVKAEGKLSWMSEVMMTEVTFVNKVSQRLLSKIVVHCWAILQFGRFS